MNRRRLFHQSTDRNRARHMRGQQPPKEGISRVGGRTRRVDVIVHHPGMNRPAAEVADAIKDNANRSRTARRTLAQRVTRPRLT